MEKAVSLVIMSGWGGGVTTYKQCPLKGCYLVSVSVSVLGSQHDSFGRLWPRQSAWQLGLLTTAPNTCLSCSDPIRRQGLGLLVCG